jgi:Icc-related predicted phosphoesterase
MRILAVSDIHKSESGLDFVLEKIKSLEPELVLLCGDVTTFGPESFAKTVVSSIPIKTFSVPGNCDPPELHHILDEGSSKNLHGRSEKFRDFWFAGWGGSNISGLNTVYETPEPKIEKGLEEVLSDISKDKSIPIILLAHTPPLGFVDYVPSIDKHIGSSAIAGLVDKYKPVLTVSGHVHEAQGIETDTKRGLIIVNTGPAKEHCAALIELGRPEDVKEDPINNIHVQLIS